jgi:cobalt/nickel transport system ATP-binding protein
MAGDRVTHQTSPLVEVDCTAHTYPDGTTGMHDIEFAVYPDEIVAVCGENGAGKSTLLEHLNGILVPDEGELRIRGESAADDPDVARREVGFVFQDADTQLVAPTVIDDVMFGPKNYGATDEEARERAQAALEEMDAGHLTERVPHYLSGGEKRLVALAGVGAMDPSVVVMDEPLSGLDPVRAKRVIEMIERLHDEGVSLVLSTHDVDFAAGIADRVSVMAEGKQIGHGTPQEVFYDEELLEQANLEPPTAVHIARRAQLASDEQLVTEDELVRLLAQKPTKTDGVEVAPFDGNAPD